MKHSILFKSILYCVIVIAICEVLNTVFPSEAVEIQKANVKKMLDGKDSIQSLTYGRSHAYGLDYKYWDYKGENFCMGGEDIASIKYHIDYSVPQLKNLKEVLICISYSSLYFDNQALSHGNLNDARRSFYSVIPSYKLISENDFSNMFFGKLFVFMHDEYGFKELRSWLFPSKEQKIFKKMKTETAKAPIDSSFIMTSAKTQAFIHSRDKIIAERYDADVIKKNSEILYEIARYLKSKNVKCIFFSAPYYLEYTRQYPQQDIIQTESIIKDICRKTGALYFNYARYKPIASDASLYADGDHVNLEGRKKFSTLFNKAIRNKTAVSSEGAEILY